MSHVRFFVPAALLLLAGGCAKTGELDASGGISAVRSACPSVGVPSGTGDVTLFDPAGARTADAIDVVALITGVRSTCDSSGPQVATNVTFRVDARRRDTGAPRDVVLPFFVTVVQGGNVVVAKRVSRVGVHFDAGQARASANGVAGASIDRAAATLPESVRKRLTEKRKAGEEDAAIDPLTRPEVRQAVLRSTFEALVGFQLTQDQLQYNATR